jgi:hypothetical protein
LSSGVQDISAKAFVPYQSGSAEKNNNIQRQSNSLAEGKQASLSTQTSIYSAPQISGPYQERLSAEELKLAVPQAESFPPDGSLNFISATLPGDLNIGTYSSAQYAVTGSGNIYYPSSAATANNFYVQTASGLGTVGGCSYKGYLPLWADINSQGNFYVYEWYPGQNTPSVRWWGWSGAGLKKGWFSGDVPGWHILSYNCGDWSNYIYIYVFPKTIPGSSSTFVYTSNTGSLTNAYLPTGAPTPPDPNTENLILPDYSLYKPNAGQALQGSDSLQSSYPAKISYPPQTSYPVQTGSSAKSNYPVKSSYPGKSSYSAGFGSSAKASSFVNSCTTCTGQTLSNSNACDTGKGNCQTCTSSNSLTAPYGYAPGSYKAVYPVPSTCRCNEYYVQKQPGTIGTVAGVFSGEWLPLWSKTNRNGVYWSFEWTICQNQQGYYCSPEVKSFGYKNACWYQTWFRGDKPGWHILSYYCNDWSNYIYIYVWPAN